MTAQSLLLPRAALRWIGVTIMLAVAAVRCTTVFAPDVIFDVDPASTAVPFAGLGPAGSLTLDVLLLIGAALTWLGARNRRMNWIMLVLALAPTPIIIWHGAGDLGDLWRGMTWLSAIIAGIAMARVASDRAVRVVVMAVLLAIIAPLIVRGAAQVSYEHAATVEAFEAGKTQFLAEHGWEEGSSAALIFERRLRQPQPLGWFATTNVLASLLACGMTVWVGLMIACIQRKAPSGYSGVLALLAIGAGAGLWLSGSKGALAVTAVALVVVGMPLIAPRVRAWITPGRARWIGPALVGLVILGVLARGMVLPEGFAGDKSVLFRWHYLVSASRIVIEQPITGVGPDGFQSAYTQHRLPRNPEEVSSAHNVFVDWLATLGVISVLWIAIIIVWLMRAARAIDAPDINRDDGLGRLLRIAAYISAVIACAMLINWIIVEGPTLDPMGWLVRIVGAMALIAVALLLVLIIDDLPDGMCRWSFSLGAIALLMHSQIEMTMTRPGAVVWCMMLLGVAGSRDDDAETARAERAPMRFIGPAIIIALTGWLLIAGVVPAWRQHAQMQRAADTLRPLARGEGNELQRRRTAVLHLRQAYEGWPTSEHPLLAAIEQLHKAALQTAPDDAPGLLLEAVALAERAVQEHSSGAAVVAQVDLNQRLAELTGDPAYRRDALVAAQRLTELDPNGLFPWRRFGDVLWILGRRDDAADAYRRALAVSEQFELDPLKQLTERQRAELQRRVREAEQEPEG